MAKNSQKTAIVTGASTGIGRATAQALARAGFAVFGTSRRTIEDPPKNVTMLVCDVTNDDSVKALVSNVLSRTSRIDLLVNNAGLGLIGAAEDSSVPQVQSLFDVNVFGVMRMTNAVLPSMRQRQSGRIVNIGSILGLIPSPFSAHYSSTKHAIEGYSESLDHEVRAFNVRVAIIEPGFTRSDFDQNALEPDAPLDTYNQARADARAVVRDSMLTADPVEVVAKTVVRAATAWRMRRRYTAGSLARQISLLRQFMPAGLFDSSLRKQLRLPA